MQISELLTLSDTLTELFLLLVAFALCALIGVERQYQQKAEGFRTHVGGHWSRRIHTGGLLHG